MQPTSDTTPKKKKPSNLLVIKDPCIKKMLQLCTFNVPLSYFNFGFQRPTLIHLKYQKMMSMLQY